jgi:serine/threonine-protein kinase
MSAVNWVGRSIGGRYQIESLLGQGGMSAVYKATDPNLRRTVAIKLIHPHLSTDPEFVRRFEQEAAAVAQLRHPNIIQVFDFNHDAEVYYMVLEFVPGETLQSRLKALHASSQRLPLADVSRIMATICEAVNYAHRRGMVHRDLKPANVMLDLQGQPILMDFGVAKIVGGQQHTATGAILGTVAYMSPEQIKGAGVDERADIYSLGVMLYEMAAGRPPFEGDSAMTVMFKHVNEPPPDISQFNADAPEALKAVIVKALAKEPGDRFQSCAEMAAALRAASPAARPVPASTFVAESPAATAAPTSAAARPPASEQSTITSPSAAPTVTAVRPARAGLGQRGLLIGVLALAGVGVIGLLLVVAWQLFAGQASGALPEAQGMVRISAGVYLVGVNAGSDEYAPLQQVNLTEFWIDRLEVTNAQYAEFVTAKGAAPPTGWQGSAYPAGEANRPVQGVAWQPAAEYCAWANKRLPAEAEWEVAARGPGSYLFPWGSNEKSVTLPQDGTYDVGSIAANRSPFGAFDMAGNVWEWVSNPYVEVPAGQQVLRGGAYNFLKDMAYRLVGDPDLPTMVAAAGFRCAAPQVEGAPTAEPVALLPTESLEGVLYQDEFANPASGWPVVSASNSNLGYHPQSFYHLELTSQNDTLIASRELGFANYLAETEALVDHTGTEGGVFHYGLVVRRTGADYYAFTIAPLSKTWMAVMSSAGRATVLAEGSEDSIQAGKGVNRLQVEANGPNFAFMINGRPVAQFTDATFGAGEVGFILQNVDNTLVHVHYNSLTLREVETAVATVEPAPTPIPPTPTATAAPPTATATPEPTETAIFAPEGMALIPAGAFRMGSESGQVDERPVHEVRLNAFFMDQFEVTNGRYQRCVDAGACDPPGTRGSFTRALYFGDPEYLNYPVISVTWRQATAFCEWEGKRLPSEAEWEYAARGTDERAYPWGDAFDVALIPANVNDTVETGSLAGNVSPFGIHDMAGNVGEWVADWHSRTYYAESPAENPAGPEAGTQKVYRGGSFGNADGAFYTATRRYRQGPGFRDVDIGFRCAQSLP